MEKRDRLRLVEAQHGRLKIFLGAAPGVGKTHAMLAGAHQLRAEGRDVVVGIADTHGREETERLLEGLEALTPRRVEPGGHDGADLDLDGALARRPEVLLVDELARSNVGGRHPKRWQDVQELLAAGIDVHATLNVQHLESLNDIVGSITGARVRETVPDTVFEDADEVVLVDLTPDELLLRLEQGKVHLDDIPARAATSYFRKGNLLALRELALRRTASRVGSQARAFERVPGGGDPRRAEEGLIACVGTGPGAEKVVREASRLARALQARWQAVFVETPSLQQRGKAQRANVMRVLRLAEELGAETLSLSGSDAASVVAEHARRHGLTRVVLGRGADALRLPWREESRFGTRLARLAPDLDLVQVAHPERLRTPKHSPVVTASLRDIAWRPLIWAGLVPVAITLVATPLVGRLDPVNIIMLYLLGIVAVASQLGRAPAVVTAISSVLAFDFFFVEPRISFAVADVQHLFTFAVMLATGMVIAQLTANLRYEARVASHREERTRQLFETARDLSGSVLEQQVVRIAVASVRTALGAPAALALLDDADELRAASVDADSPAMDLAIARWCHDHGQAAGRGTATMPAAPLLYIPLKAPIRTRGVLAIAPGEARMPFGPEQRRLLDTHATLVATALERVHFVSVAQRTLVRVESESLRNALLAALSHDLRTPLTALMGLADSLARDAGGSGLAERAASLSDQARRLALLVDHLLEMARLQAGGVQLRRDWQSIEELVASAVRSLESALSRHDVVIDLSRDVPLVRCDGVLVERVLANLLENAAKYTAPGTRVRITADVSLAAVTVIDEDDGPGLPAGKETELFEKFVRGAKESSVPGVGLGLAISRAIVEAHGGRIEATARPGGGAHFRFSLPRDPDEVAGEIIIPEVV